MRITTTDHMSTDDHWERWGSQDPYFGVLTDPRFRSSALNDQGRAEFFASGEQHVDYVIDRCASLAGGSWAPRRVLDFGCGVGRLTLPFARRAEQVVGVDVSPSMLKEASRNADQAGVANVSWMRSDDGLTAVDQTFDLVNSYIVLQHVEIQRGRQLFEALVARVAPGGFGALHVTFGWTIYQASFGQPVPAVPPPPPARPSWWSRWIDRPPTTPAPPAASADPEMQMNYYNFSELYFILHRQGIRQVQADMTDHGGALGALLIFRRAGA